MKTKCDIYRRHLSAYADGETEPGLNGAIADHLEQCPICRQELAAFRALTARSLELPQPELSPAFTAQVMGRISGRRMSPAPRFASGFATRLLYALVFIVVGLLGIALHWNLSPHFPQTESGNITAVNTSGANNANNENNENADEMNAISQKMIAARKAFTGGRTLEGYSELLSQGIGLRLSQIQDKSLAQVYNSPAENGGGIR